MPKHITLQPDLSSGELERRYRVATEPTERTWWQILWLLSQHRTAREVASVTGYSPYWIGQIAKRYNTAGPDGMCNRRHTTSYRPPPVLSAELQAALRATLAAAAARHERWTGHDVAAWISERVGRSVPYSLGYAYLVRLKHSQQLPRPRHVRADPAAQEQFKKSSVRSSGK